MSNKLKYNFFKNLNPCLSYYTEEHVIVCDIDGTLANIDHRLPILDHNFNSEKDKWNTFFKASVDDTVNLWCKSIIEGLRFKTIFLTGMNVDHYDLRKKWLDTHLDFDNYELVMRPSDNRVPVVEFKESILVNNILPRHSVLIAIDDDSRNIEMFKKYNIATLRC